MARTRRAARKMRSTRKHRRGGGFWEKIFGPPSEEKQAARAKAAKEKAEENARTNEIVRIALKNNVTMKNLNNMSKIMEVNANKNLKSEPSQVKKFFKDLLF